MEDRIVKAREKYLAKHPFNPLKNLGLSTAEDKSPARGFALSNIDELNVLSVKFGYELVAHVRTNDDFNKWSDAVMEQAESPVLADVMLLHILRVLAEIIPQIVDKAPGLTGLLEQFAVDTWEKEPEEWGARKRE